MKGDFSRLTFDPARHFSGVRMQQGRVQLDADWNEQADIARHRVETETLHTLGGCGAPLHDAGFALGAGTGGDFRISAGAYYVHGVLARCEVARTFRGQPDRPPLPALQAGDHLVYLDVWDRHLTALEVPAIRETALGGPDTATRTRTVWQVRTAPLDGTGGSGCRSAAVDEAFAQATRAGTGRLRARAQAEERASDPCVIPAGAGYRGLENQLYRVEIHDAGAGLAAPAEAEGVAVMGAQPLKGTVQVAGGDWTRGDAVELWNPAESGPTGTVTAHVARVDGQTLHLTTAFPTLAGASGLRLRRAGATYKWSRDNGIVVAGVRKVDGVDVSLDAPGLDDVLDFHPGDWVELTDAERELEGTPGVMAQVKAVNPASRTLTLLNEPDFQARSGLAPRVRRWDGFAAVRMGGPSPFAWMVVEQGIQLAWDDGSLHTGDFWHIPARTATGDQQSGTVEWPREGGVPAARPPMGPVHRYARLGIVRVEADGTVAPVTDCRCLFTPLTEVNALSYVSGTGQEALADLTRQEQYVRLPLPLVVGMANGQCRAGTRVRFRVTGGAGLLARDGEGTDASDVTDVQMDAQGRATVWWWLRWSRADQVLDQTVEAVLLEEDGEVQLPIGFTASLSVASRVAYDPGACGAMAGRVTVQQALDHIAALPRLFPVSGDGQEWMPDEIDARMETLRVRVASTCGPLAGREVRFQVEAGTGTLAGGAAAATAPTDADGIAEIMWRPDGQTPRQEVSATLVANGEEVLEHPFGTRFTFTLSTASQVSYDPGACGALQGRETVQAALDHLAALPRLFPVSGDAQEWMPAQIAARMQPLRVRVASTCGPLAGREVRFKVLAGGGTLNGAASAASVATDADGVAEVMWLPDGATPRQEVHAALLADGAEVLGQPHETHFSFTLSTAAQVAYEPGACGGMAGQATVQDAVDHLAAAARLSLVSGDAQEWMPAEIPARMQPLRVRVASACGPLAGREVRFKVESGGGALRGATEASATTDADGLAEMVWLPDDVTPHQEVSATLMGEKLPGLQAARFSFTLSTASQVAYDPGDCGALQGRKTVQGAVDGLASLASLSVVSGDGQVIMPSQPADTQPLVVRAASACGPLAGRTVVFQVLAGGGTLEGAATAEAETDADGIASITWLPDATSRRQEVTATLQAARGERRAHPYEVRFGLTLATADQVEYDPEGCGALDGVQTVQEAVSRIAGLVRLSKLSGDAQPSGPGIAPEPLRVLVSSDCGPVAKREKAVRFVRASGSGTLNGADVSEILVDTDEDGVASLTWAPDFVTPYQEVQAELAEDLRAGVPHRQRFSATVAGEGTGGGTYTLTLSADDPGWRERLDAYVNASIHVDIFFRAGRFELDRPLYFEEKGNVSLTGVGPQSEVVCPGEENAITFAMCATARVSSLYVEGGRGETDMTGLNGVLTFKSCREVEVAGCVLRCAARRRRRASCITVVGAPPFMGSPTTTVRIRDCQAWIGFRQIGFLLRDVGVALVQNNVLRVDAYPGEIPVYEELNRLRAMVPDDLDRMIKSLNPPEYDPSGEWFSPSTFPPGIIQAPARRVPAGAVARTSRVLSVDALAERLSGGLTWVRRTLSGRAVSPAGETAAAEPAGLPADAPRPELPPVVETFEPGEEYPAAFVFWYQWLRNVADQGIVVAGSFAHDVRVTGNVVDGALRGIHVAVSGNDTPEREMAGSVLVAENEVALRMTYHVGRARHGIFVGNARYVRVHHNRVFVYRAFRDIERQQNVDGIKLFGWYGPQVLVRDNVTMGTDNGVLAGGLNPAPQYRAPRQWVVSGTMARGRSAVTVVRGDWVMQDNQTWFEDP